MCSPRFENVLDHVRSAGPLQAHPEDPQRGTQDIGLGLCGAPGRRLASTMGQVTCPGCRRLLGGPAFWARTARAASQ